MPASDRYQYNNPIIKSLHKAIEGNPDFFVMALADTNYGVIRNDVSKFLNTLYNEAKKKAEDSIGYAEEGIKNMEAWRSRQNAHGDVEKAKLKLENAKKIYNTMSYKGFLDSRSLALEAQRHALDATTIQQSALKGVLERLLRDALLLQDSIKSLAVKYTSDEFEFGKKIINQVVLNDAMDNFSKYLDANKSITDAIDLFRKAEVTLKKKDEDAVIRQENMEEQERYRIKFWAKFSRTLGYGIAIAILIYAVYLFFSEISGEWQKSKLSGPIGPAEVIGLLIGFPILFIGVALIIFAPAAILAFISSYLGDKIARTLERRLSKG